MEQSQDLNLYDNPSYLEQKNKNMEMESRYSDVSSDKQVLAETQNPRFINTEIFKPTNDKKKRVWFIIVLCIATTTGVILSVAALALSLWSTFTPSTTSQGTTGVLQQNQTFVTLNHFEEVRNTLVILENDIQNLSVGLQKHLDAAASVSRTMQVPACEPDNYTLNAIDKLTSSFNFDIENLNSSLIELQTVVNFGVNSTLNSQENDINNLSSAIQTLNSVVNMESERVNDSVASNAASIQIVSDNLQTLTDAFLLLGTVSECGPGNWLRLAYINMSDSSQQCPLAWREYTTPVRSCGRPVTSSASCLSTIFATNGLIRSYNRVCGRATGYQYGSTDAFSINDIFSNRPMSVDDNYVDGVSVTHGNPRNHIWTFAAGNSVGSNDRFACPCDNQLAYRSPSFVGSNYFCESSSTRDYWTTSGTYYTNNKLWDGRGCVRGTCCTFNSPPWFTVVLPSSTSDDIEVRICGDERTSNEDVPIVLLEIYVQ